MQKRVSRMNPRDAKLAVMLRKTETKDPENSTKQFVQTVAEQLKFLSFLQRANLYTVAIATLP
jgi:hypothetical protein